MAGYFTRAAVIALLPCAAMAQPRTIEWFLQHPREAEALAGHCYQGAERSVASVECANANSAASEIMSQRYLQEAKRYANYEDPAFWDANPLARAITLNECVHPSVPALQPSALKCRAAALSQMHSGGK